MSFSQIDQLKCAYFRDDGHINPVTMAAKEAAAYELGTIYENWRCPNNAVWWFRRSLSLARATGVKESIISNLYRLAWNLETLTHNEEASQCYNEMLSLLENISPSIATRKQQYIGEYTDIAIHKIRHGDQACGEAIMRELFLESIGRPVPTIFKTEKLPLWFSVALEALGLHYIATDRPHEAVKLAKVVQKNVHRFENPDDEPNATQVVRNAMQGLIAKAFVHKGQLDKALKELSKVHNVETTEFIPNEGRVYVEDLELWIDIARIHVANHDYERAITAYEILAYNLGALISYPPMALTTRKRMYWLYQMAFVVHEMVSVWLTIPGLRIRRLVEAKVANALLQLKGNLFLAIQLNKQIRYPSPYPPEELFEVNRKYAAAGRKLINTPNNEEALLEFEDALIMREDIELVDQSQRSMMLKFDFRESFSLEEDMLLLDYSLIDYRPPCKGLAGPSQGFHYIGIRLSKGRVRLIDLGQAKQIETFCRSLIQAMSTQPVTAKDMNDSHQSQRQLLPENWDQPKDKVNLDDLNKKVYNHIVAPFEPLSRSLLISPDGILASLPFHALIHDNRYLIEDKDIAFCHSLIQKESMTDRVSRGSNYYIPPINISALLLGDPDYTTSSLPSLLGTKLEVARVAELLRNKKNKDGKKIFDEVLVYTGADATVSKLLELERPFILHIAAHGIFDENQAGQFVAQQVIFGGYYQRWERLGAWPFTKLDNVLLNSKLILAKDPEVVRSTDRGDVLTALEISSVNLLDCEVIVLSACETGMGVSEYGTGMLGFQYALKASLANSGLLSLWKVLDRETSIFMIDFYQSFLDQGSPKEGYFSAVRKNCRRNGQRIHPYYWAAFIFLDQGYGGGSFSRSRNILRN